MSKFKPGDKVRKIDGTAFSTEETTATISRKEDSLSDRYYLKETNTWVFGRNIELDIPKPDYNDGKWHPWTGGECPVHPKSMVRVMLNKGNIPTAFYAHVYAWGYNTRSPIVAFQVTKAYREPREYWIGNNPLCGHSDVSDSPRDGYIHVREVMDE